MTAFPSYHSIQSYSEVLGRPTVRRTPFESGHIQQSRLFFNTWLDVELNILLSQAQYDDFLTFYRDDILNGADTFDFPNWKSGSGTITARIKNGDFSVNPIRTYNSDYWFLTLTLEYQV